MDVKVISIHVIHLPSKCSLEKAIHRLHGASSWSCGRSFPLGIGTFISGKWMVHWNVDSVKYEECKWRLEINVISLLFYEEMGVVGNNMIHGTSAFFGN